jgi:hypothetical protein
MPSMYCLRKFLGGISPGGHVIMVIVSRATGENRDGSHRRKRRVP